MAQPAPPTTGVLNGTPLAAARLTGSVAGPFGSATPVGDTIGTAVGVPKVAESWPAANPSGVLADTSSPAVEAEPHCVCRLKTLGPGGAPPEIAALRKSQARPFNTCQSSARFCARGCPTSATPTWTGQFGSNRTSSLNWRKDSSGGNRSSVQPEIGLSGGLGRTVAAPAISAGR